MVKEKLCAFNGVLSMCIARSITSASTSPTYTKPSNDFFPIIIQFNEIIEFFFCVLKFILGGKSVNRNATRKFATIAIDINLTQ